MNQSSTRLRAHGVWRRNVRLALTVGLNWKQRTGMRRPIVAAQPVDDAIGAAYHFAQIRLTEFRHHAANFREVCQTLGAGDQFKTETGGGIGIMLGDVADNFRQVRL